MASATEALSDAVLAIAAEHAVASPARSTSPTKEGAAEFSDGDQALIETFAVHAAPALENARLHERSRELSIVEERNRRAALGLSGGVVELRL